MYKFDDDEFLTIPEAATYLNVTEDIVRGFVGYCYTYCKYWAHFWHSGTPEDDPKYLQGIGKLGEDLSFGMLATRDQRWWDRHAPDRFLPCVPTRHHVEVTATRYLKYDGRPLTKRRTFIIDEYLSTIVEAGLFSIKDLDQLAIQHGFEQRHFSSNTGESRDSDDTPQGRPPLHTEAKSHPLEEFRSMNNLKFQEIHIRIDPERLVLRISAREKEVAAPFTAIGIVKKNEIILNRQGEILMAMANGTFNPDIRGTLRAISRLSESLRKAFKTPAPPSSGRSHNSSYPSPKIKRQNNAQ